jgi:transposase
VWQFKTFSAEVATQACARTIPNKTRLLDCELSAHIISYHPAMPARSPIKYALIEEVPEVFQSTGAIGRSAVRKYSDLSSHSFAKDEKLFLCQELAKKRTDGPLVMDYTEMCKARPVVTPKGVSQRYNLSIETVRWWLKKFQHGEVFNAENCQGAPKALDETSLNVVSAWANEAVQNKRPVTFPGLMEVLGKEKATSAQRRGRLLSTEEARVDTKTAHKIAEKLGIKLQTAAEEAERWLSLTQQQQALEKKRKADRLEAKREAKKAKM